MIKPVYGFLSDAVPIYGYRRCSYLAICGLLGGCWVGAELVLGTCWVGAGWVAGGADGPSSAAGRGARWW